MFFLFNYYLKNKIHRWSDTLHLQSHKKLFYLFLTLPQILYNEEHHCESTGFSWHSGGEKTWSHRPSKYQIPEPHSEHFEGVCRCILRVESAAKIAVSHTNSDLADQVWKVYDILCVMSSIKYIQMKA